MLFYERDSADGSTDEPNAMVVDSPSSDVTAHDERTPEERALMLEYAAAQADLAVKRDELEAAREQLKARERGVATADECRMGVRRDAPKAVKAMMDNEEASAKARWKEARAALPRIEASLRDAEQRIDAAKARDFALRGYQDDWKTLNETKGYLVVPFKEHGITFDHSNINYKDNITNPEDGAPSTGRRLMGHLNGRSTAPSIKKLETDVSGFMKRRRWLRTATGTDKAAFLECKETRALKAEASCPKQKRHADSADRNSLRDEPWGDVSKVVLLFPEGGTLHVYPFDEEGEITLTLEPGDLVIFRGDLGHAGAAYDVENVRGHVFIDSHVIKRKLVNGKTATFFF